jgi:hypothetical protein
MVFQNRVLNGENCVLSEFILFNVGINDQWWQITCTEVESRPYGTAEYIASVCVSRVACHLEGRQMNSSSWLMKLNARNSGLDEF